MICIFDRLNTFFSPWTHAKIFVVLECKRGNYLHILIYENDNNWQFVILIGHIAISLQ